MVLVRKLPFFQLFFFQAKKARKMSFMIFQDVKTPFYALKTRSLKKPKIDIFPKGLTHGFGPKMAVFPTIFFLENIKRSLKRRKIDIFQKGLTHGFGPKIAIFPNFFFQGIQARKMSFMIFQNEKTPFHAIKTRRSKSRKRDFF